MPHFPLRQTTCFFIPLVDPCTLKRIIFRHNKQTPFTEVFRTIQLYILTSHMCKDRWCVLIWKMLNHFPSTRRTFAYIYVIQQLYHFSGISIFQCRNIVFTSKQISTVRHLFALVLVGQQTIVPDSDKTFGGTCIKNGRINSLPGTVFSFHRPSFL